MTPIIHRPIHLVCFDLDGTIIDSEPLHQRAKEHLVKELGYEEPICYGDFVGKSNRVFWNPIIANVHPVGETAETLEQKQNSLILKMVEEEKPQPNEGLRELLNHIAGQGIPMAVCSSSDHYYIEKMLSLLNLSQWFGCLVGGDEVPNKKPAPDIYCKALEICGTEACRAIAIEDSTVGVVAATKAGIACLGYRNPTSGNQDLSRASGQIDRLWDILLYL